MNVSIDFVTLTLEFDCPQEELRCALEDSLRGPGVERMIRHELAHLLSFLGSPLSDLHRVIISIQADMMKAVLCDVSIEGTSTELTIPLLDLKSKLHPNTCPSEEFSQIELYLWIWKQLDLLRCFYVGGDPGCTSKELLQAHAFLIKLFPQIKHASTKRAFIRPELFKMLYPNENFDPRNSLADCPILPEWKSIGSPEAELITLTSQSVLEGLAVLGELLFAERKGRLDNLRACVPNSYSGALKYALETVCAARGLEVTYDDLIKGDAPSGLMCTLAGIFDLALQIPFVGQFTSDQSRPKDVTDNAGADFIIEGTVTELCPAWRLCFLCKAFNELNLPLLKGSTDDYFRDFLDLQRDLTEASVLDWTPPEVFSITASEQFVERYKSSTHIAPNDIYPYLSCFAKISRDRSEIGFVQQLWVQREGEWLDFVGFRYPGAHFEPHGPGQSCVDFFTTWDREYYRLAACIQGKFWDKWWEEWAEESYGDVQEAIRNALGAVCSHYASNKGSEWDVRHWKYINTIPMAVRSEFDYGWAR